MPYCNSRQHNYSQFLQKPVLDKYVALYAAEMIKQNTFADAVKAFKTYGAPANQQNFNLYKRLIDEVISMKNTFTGEAYETWAALRDMLYDLVNIQFDGENSRIFHYYSVTNAISSVKIFAAPRTTSTLDIWRFSTVSSSLHTIMLHDRHCCLSVTQRDRRG